MSYGCHWIFILIKKQYWQMERKQNFPFSLTSLDLDVPCTHDANSIIHIRTHRVLVHLFIRTYLLFIEKYFYVFLFYAIELVRLAISMIMFIQLKIDRFDAYQHS